ncbi:MAG: hypothetical protein JW866_08890, partial [Ignavibacteriales bacterium]|nr:hypothetical protein [Ignavibacteriales bacterium]
NGKEFFVVFAIVFPAFTGMTAGVGLSGDLRNPKKSIPIGTISATFAGMIIYFFIIWKLSVSASPEDLISNQLIMSKIALFGFIVIPLGLAASTISSAIGSVLVAPRTLQAICTDNSFPIKRFNRFFSKGVGELNEPYNATVLTSIIALAFVIMGDVNAVAEIISMFFMVTYGSLCLISFLHHFGADPSYRPSFKSKWYISMLGFLMCVYLMFQINTPYAIVAIVIMMILYIYLSNHHKDRNGLEAIFQGAIFQLSRKFQVFLQKKKKADLSKNWRPSAVCVSKDSFERDKAFNLLNWISYKYGFGTYIHLIDGYYSKSTNQESRKILQQLIDRHNVGKYNVYIDTLISPSYTSAIAQIAQLPSPSGMENNMIVFEFDKHNPKNLKQVIENIALVQSGDFDILILGNSSRIINFKKGIHIWIRELTQKNANLIILLSYIFLSHPDWSKGFIKLFSVCKEEKVPEIIEQLNELVLSGRLQITKKNIDIIIKDEDISLKSIVNEYSKDAGLTIIGFSEELLKHTGEELFLGYDQVGDILFVEAASSKTIDYG